MYVGGYEDGGPVIYKTVNGGINWSRLTCVGISFSIYDLAIDPDSTNIIYAGAYGGIHKSTDGGQSWIDTGFSGGRTNVLLIDTSTGQGKVIYAGTQSNGVYRSTDAGGSWTQMNSGLDDLCINCFGTNPGEYIFAGTEGGSIYRWLLDSGVGDLNRLPHARSVLDVQPNPFKNKTTISIVVGHTIRNGKLRIYNTSGRLVKDFPLTSYGAHGALYTTWDGTDKTKQKLPAGVYFIEIEGMITHKVVKVK